MFHAIISWEKKVKPDLETVRPNPNLLDVAPTNLKTSWTAMKWDFAPSVFLETFHCFLQSWFGIERCTPLTLYIEKHHQNFKYLIDAQVRDPSDFMRPSALHAEWTHSQQSRALHGRPFLSPPRLAGQVILSLCLGKWLVHAAIKATEQSTFSLQVTIWGISPRFVQLCSWGVDIRGYHPRFLSSFPIQYEVRYIDWKKDSGLRLPEFNSQPHPYQLWGIGWIA